MKPLITKNIFNIYIYENNDEYYLEIPKKQAGEIMNLRVNNDAFKFKKLFNFNSYFVFSNQLLRTFSDNVKKYSMSHDVFFNTETNLFNKKKGTYILSFEKNDQSKVFIDELIERIKKYDDILTPNIELEFITNNILELSIKTENGYFNRANDKTHAILVTKEDAFLILKCKEKINPDDTITATLSARKLTFEEYNEFINDILKKDIHNDYFRLFQTNSIIQTAHFIYPEIIKSDEYNMHEFWESINQFFSLKNTINSNNNTKNVIKI